MSIVIPAHISCLTGAVITELLAEQGLSHEYLKAINIPGSVKEIGNGAFSECKNLKRVTMHDGVESIGYMAFSGVKLEAINLPGSVKVIEGYAFWLCENLKCVTIQEGVESIGYMAFSETKLKAITIPGSVKVIEGYAFWLCENLKCVTIEEGVKRVVEYAFSGAGLEKVTIPGSMKLVGAGAFNNCENLKCVTIEAGVEYIGKDSFRNTSLESVTIPGSVKVIGKSAFERCKNLKDITIEPYIECIDGGTSREIGLEGTVIPASMNEIMQGVCNECNRLKILILPTAFEGRYAEGLARRLGLHANVQIIYNNDFKKEVQEKLNAYNKRLAQEKRLKLQDMLRYSTLQLYTVWHVLSHEQDVSTSAEEISMVREILAGMSCRDSLNIRKQFPKALYLRSWEISVPRVDLSLGVEWELVSNIQLVCQSQRLSLRSISLAWLSPFLTVKETARSIIAMLASKDGQAQIADSMHVPVIPAASIVGGVVGKPGKQGKGRPVFEAWEGACRYDRGVRVTKKHLG